MATIEQYNEAAPFVQSIGNFTVDQIETKLASIPKPPAPVEPQAPTKAAIVALFNEVHATSDVNKAIEAAGGLELLAAKHDMTRSQCETCLREFAAMKAVYETPEDVTPEDVTPEE